MSLSEERYVYPKARRCPCTIDKYHGKSVPDPYRWLENPESEDTKTFVAEQNKLTASVLQQCPFRDDIKKQLTQFLDFPNIFCPSRAGNNIFYYKNSGLQNQKVLYVQDPYTGNFKIVVDANTFSEDGTVAVTGHSVSRSGEIVAYKVSRSGSDWVTIHFKNVTTDKDLSDFLKNIKFTNISWTHDNQGIFYTAYPQTKETPTGAEVSALENAKVYYHKLFTVQSQDILIAEFPENPRWMRPQVSDCGNYLINAVTDGCQYNMVQIAEIELPLKNEKLDFKPIITEFEAEYEYVTNDGGIFYFHTDKNAPNFRLIAIDIDDPQEASWKTVITEDRNDKVLSRVKAANYDKLLTLYTQDVRNTLQLRNLYDGSLIQAFHTEMGNVTTFTAERHLAEIFYEVSSFTSPKHIFHIDLDDYTHEPHLFAETTLDDFDPHRFATVQIMFPSKDGTKIPMYIIKKKSTFQNGENPCLLYGYGGFNISVLPNFNAFHMFFVTHFDGILAIANIRGGGEFGSKWHENGSCMNKQNSFDDFQAAATYLIDNYYTNKQKLAIRGASNGGLLTAACITQRPELFRAAIIQNGVLDMLRFPKFTIGQAWCTEYGCPDKPQEFEYLLKYSPLHNVRMPLDHQYPSVLVTSADHDDRVPPLHSYKFISELQSAVGHHLRQTNPLLIRIETKGGHGVGASLGKQIQEWTDILSFLSQELDAPFNL